MNTVTIGSVWRSFRREQKRFAYVQDIAESAAADSTLITYRVCSKDSTGETRFGEVQQKHRNDFHREWVIPLFLPDFLF